MEPPWSWEDFWERGAFLPPQDPRDTLGFGGSGDEPIPERDKPLLAALSDNWGHPMAQPAPPARVAVNSPGMLQGWDPLPWAGGRRQQDISSASESSAAGGTWS